jgi:hypothetical protein
VRPAVALAQPGWAWVWPAGARPWPGAAGRSWLDMSVAKRCQLGAARAWPGRGWLCAACRGLGVARLGLGAAGWGQAMARCGPAGAGWTRRPTAAGWGYLGLGRPWLGCGWAVARIRPAEASLGTVAANRCRLGLGRPWLGCDMGRIATNLTNNRSVLGFNIH